MKDLMKKYTRAFSVSGREASLAAQIAEDLRPFADSVSTDAMGNLIVLKKGKNGGKKLMLAAHMDEIGFIATFIEDSGYIRVSNIGGINAVASAYHKVVFENGTTGVLVVESGTAFGDVAVKKMYVDIGARSKKEAERKVKVGDCLAVAPELTKLGANALRGQGVRRPAGLRAAGGGRPHLRGAGLRHLLRLYRAGGGRLPRLQARRPTPIAPGLCHRGRRDQHGRYDQRAADDRQARRRRGHQNQGRVGALLQGYR